MLYGLGAASLGAALRPSALAAPVAPASRYPDLIGQITYYVTKQEDTLPDLARSFNVGFTELIAANPGVDPWVPGEGVILVIPSAHVLPASSRKGIVLNLGDQRLYFFKPDGATVESVPIGIGTEGWDTPTGQTRVVRKRADPTWYVPKSIRKEQPELPAVVPPGPDNPLGRYAIDLGWRSYLMHGTNKPMGVGRRVSHGCVRLYPEDIARLFKEVELGTPVAVVDQPVKTAWVGRRLMLEVHPSQKQADQLEANGNFDSEEPQELVYRLTSMAQNHAAELDWTVIKRAVRERRGIPLVILEQEDTAPSKS